LTKENRSLSLNIQLLEISQSSEKSLKSLGFVSLVPVGQHSAQSAL
jgi:hypothetical protein